MAENTRHIFTAPPGFEAIRDSEGRATGEIRTMADNSGLMTTVDPHEYAQSYESRDPDYAPTDAERALIEDAICGYLSLPGAHRTPVTAEAGEVSEAEVDAAVAAFFDACVEYSEFNWMAIQNGMIQVEGTFPKDAVFRAALLAVRRVQPKQDAPSPDVAGLIEALHTLSMLVLQSQVYRSDPDIRDAVDVGLALARLTPPKQGECCVADEGEPQFVLPGRDPQAPALVEEWARIRRLAEPESPKPAMADEIAAKMRAYKAAHPEKGMATSALPKQVALCEICGLPLPPGEEMFKYHGHSGPCPLPLEKKYRTYVDERGTTIVTDDEPVIDDVGPEEEESSLASARADGVREGLERAAEAVQLLERSHGAPIGFNTLLAAIRALINKDAGGNRG